MKNIFQKIRSIKHRGSISLVLGSVMGVAGLGALSVGLLYQQSPPRPLPSTYTTSKPAVSQRIASTSSEPIAIQIPSIRVSSDIIQVANNPDKTIEVPSGTNYNKAAWYKYSVMPGDIGSSVILGHVDSAETGPSIFYNLGKLKPGETVDVTRADSSKLTFEVYKVGEYSKDTFPTTEVYGPSDGSTLKLITCSGPFDTRTGEYENNIIVYASLKAENGKNLP